jgi:excisionase family DNA binding protein
MPADRLLKINEVCNLLSISKSTIYNLINEGKLCAPIKIGRSSRWRLSYLESFIDRQTISETVPKFIAAGNVTNGLVGRKHLDS